MSDGAAPSHPGFDAAVLDRFLRQAIPGLEGSLTLHPISGGQSNPTYFVDYANRRMVLRKKPAGPLLPSAHAIDREHRVMAALQSTDVPMPRMLLYHPSDNLIGTPFYVMERLEGRVFADCTLPGVTPEHRRAMYFDMADTLARLHRVDYQAIGLADYGRPGNYFARQIARWTRQWETSKTGPNTDIDRLTAWLPAHIPAGDVTTISHGDFRIGNLMFHPVEPKVIGVLDWELSTLGHPLADLAYSALAWRLAPDEYMGMRDNDLEALGIPSEHEYIERYHVTAPEFGRVTTFHAAFSLFRLAVIFEGIAARARAGQAAADNAAQAGALSGVFARQATQALDDE
jgi:aminoglycoside phosphotransferase (APT) family kinase protein